MFPGRTSIPPHSRVPSRHATSKFEWLELCAAAITSPCIHTPPLSGRNVRITGQFRRRQSRRSKAFITRRTSGNSQGRPMRVFNGSKLGRDTWRYMAETGDRGLVVSVANGAAFGSAGGAVQARPEGLKKKMTTARNYAGAGG